MVDQFTYGRNGPNGDTSLGGAHTRNSKPGSSAPVGLRADGMRPNTSASGTIGSTKAHPKADATVTSPLPQGGRQSPAGGSALASQTPRGVPEGVALLLRAESPMPAPGGVVSHGESSLQGTSATASAASLRDPNDGTNTAQKLLDAYLAGKLSQGELAHQLRVYNSVVADQIIKDGKRAPTSAVNYIEVTRATMENPGGVYPEPPEKTQPKKGLGGGYGPAQPDEDEAKKMREKEEKQEEQQQQRQRIQVDQANEEDREAKEVQHQHMLAEEERKREEEEALGLGEGLDGLSALARTSFGTISRARQAVSPQQVRRELAQQELEKQKEESRSESQGASHENR